MSTAVSTRPSVGGHPVIVGCYRPYELCRAFSGPVPNIRGVSYEHAPPTLRSEPPDRARTCDAELGPGTRRGRRTRAR
jgi:hypothetical protein